VPDEEGGGLVVAERVVLPVQHGHRLDRHVGESRPVSCVELESVFLLLFGGGSGRLLVGEVLFYMNERERGRKACADDLHARVIK
jgi:hypothetical protein